MPTVTGEMYEGLSVSTVDALAYGLASVTQLDGECISPRSVFIREQVRAVSLVLAQRGLTDARAAESQAALRAKDHAQGLVLPKENERNGGLLLLREVAVGHRVTAVWAGRLECTVCRASPGEDIGAAWPCPVWICAVQLGAVDIAEDIEISNT